MSTTIARGLAPVRAVLANGAVVIAQRTVMTPALTISAVFRAGSSAEPPDRTGLAYLTSRIVDRGTERRDAAVIAQELDDRGVSLKVATNRHGLILTCTCLAEDFPDILSIVVDVARRPTFPETEIVKRRAEAITAVRQDQDNPAARALEGLLGLLYGRAHPYGRPVKGTIASLESIGRDDITRFHGEYVRPSALTLAIVGDVSPDHAIDRSRSELESWPSGTPAPVRLPATSRVDSRQSGSILMTGKSQSDIAYGFTTIPRLDPRYYAYWMMNNILGQFGLGGRLADNIRERQGMAYYAVQLVRSRASRGTAHHPGGRRSEKRGTRDRRDRPRGRDPGSRGPDRAGNERNPAVPGWLDSAPARDEPEHCVVSADG